MYRALSACEGICTNSSYVAAPLCKLLVKTQGPAVASVFPSGQPLETVHLPIVKILICPSKTQIQQDGSACLCTSSALLEGGRDVSRLVGGILIHDLICCRTLFFHQVPILQKGPKEHYLAFPGLSLWHSCSVSRGHLANVRIHWWTRGGLHMLLVQPLGS